MKTEEELSERLSQAATDAIAHIDTLSQTIARRDEEIARLKATIEQLKMEKAELADQTNALQTRIEGLEHNLSKQAEEATPTTVTTTIDEPTTTESTTEAATIEDDKKEGQTGTTTLGNSPQTPTEALADSLSKTHIKNLNEALTLSDRFLFQRELFGNNADKMTEALNALNLCDSKDAAEDYLSENYAEWDPDDATVQQFLILLSRKFKA